MWLYFMYWNVVFVCVCCVCSEEEDSLFLGGHDTLHFDMSHTTLGAFGSDDTFQVDAPSFLVDDQ